MVKRRRSGFLLLMKLENKTVYDARINMTIVSNPNFIDFPCLSPLSFDWITEFQHIKARDRVTD